MDEYSMGPDWVPARQYQIHELWKRIERAEAALDFLLREHGHELQYVDCIGRYVVVKEGTVLQLPNKADDCDKGE